MIFKLLINNHKLVMSQNKSEPYKFFFRPKIVTKYIVGITLI